MKNLFNELLGRLKILFMSPQQREDREWFLPSEARKIDKKLQEIKTTHGDTFGDLERSLWEQASYKCKNKL